MGYGKDLRSGFSLVEMIITMFIFTILALALTKSLIFSMYVAEDNLYEATALTVATSLVEQIKGASFAKLENPDKDDGKDIFQMLVAGGQQTKLTLGEETELSVPLVTEAGGTTSKTFIVRITPTITEMTEGEGYWITVEYQYDHPRNGLTRTRVVRNARTDIHNS